MHRAFTYPRSPGTRPSRRGGGPKTGSGDRSPAPLLVAWDSDEGLQNCFLTWTHGLALSRRMAMGQKFYLDWQEVWSVAAFGGLVCVSVIPVKGMNPVARSSMGATHQGSKGDPLGRASRSLVFHQDQNPTQRPWPATVMEIAINLQGDQKRPRRLALSRCIAGLCWVSIRQQWSRDGCRSDDVVAVGTSPPCQLFPCWFESQQIQLLPLYITLCSNRTLDSLFC